MANYWVDSALGSGDNDGSSPANAVRGTSAIKTAMEVDHDAGTKVWIRRTSAYDEGVANNNADIAPTTDGTPEAPTYFIGWPRPAITNATITQADWTNGSTTIDNIVGITCGRLSHQSRYATAPDGKVYFITRVVDSNTIIIDREYAGGTVTGTDGKFQIEADEDWADRPAEGTAAGWDADSYDVPTIDFNDEEYQLVMVGDNYISYRNINFIDSGDTYGIIYIVSSKNTEMMGCLLKQNASNAPCMRTSNLYLNIKRTTVEGSGSGSSQRGIYFLYTNLKLTDAAIYNMGSNGLQVSGATIKLNNVNIGIEIANGEEDIRTFTGSVCYGSDVKLGGTNGYIAYDSETQYPGRCSFDNYQKILGNNIDFLGQMYSKIVAVTSTNANKKLSDYVLQVYPYVNEIPINEDLKTVVFEGAFKLTAGAHTIKFWIYNDLGQTINDTTAKDNLFLRITYCNSYDDTTEYTIAKAYSTEIDILDAADADDWDYLSASFTLSADATVYAELLASIYDATDYFLVDPEPVVT